MRHFFKFFYVFLLIPMVETAVRAAVPAREADKDAPVIHLFNKTSREASSVFISRIRLLAKLIVPEPEHALSCMLIADKTMSGGTPIAASDGKTVTIRIPMDFESFSANRKNLRRTAAWTLLAAAGMGPEYSDRIVDSWFVTAVARRAHADTYLRGLPYSDFTPGAMVLAANGTIPSLKTILSVPLPADHVSGDLYGEYCELLLLACMRKHLFASSSAEKIIRRTAMRSASAQYAVLIPELIPALRKKTETGDPDVWFRKELQSQLTNSLTPASVHQTEVEYRRILTLKWTDQKGGLHSSGIREYRTAFAGLEKEPEKKDETVLQKKVIEVKTGTRRKQKHDISAVGSRVRVKANRAVQEKKRSIQETEFFRVTQELIHLGRRIHPDLRMPLGKVRSAIVALRYQNSKENEQALLSADALFHRKLSELAAIDKFLRDTGRLTLQPGTRFFLTMQESSTKKRIFPGGRRLEALLDSVSGFESADTAALEQNTGESSK